MTLRALMKDLVESAIAEACEKELLPNAPLPDIKIEYPKEDKFGDYSTPFALETAKIYKQSPLKTGEIIKPFIEQSKLVEQVDVVSPGFINIFINKSYLLNSMETIVQQGDDYGRCTTPQPQKILLEFVSANPTGPMNVVSARAAALGDSLANILTAAGHEVEREFYVNDFGNQVLILGKSVRARVMEKLGIPAEFPDDGYQGDYIYDIADHAIARYKDNFIELDEDQQIEFLSKVAIDYNVSRQRQDLELFNVRYSRWFHESELHSRGAVAETLNFLQSTGAVYEDDGKQVFRSTDFGDDKDRVLVRDDGRPTYLLADIAYHKDKTSRQYDRIINIWGPDHHGYIARLAGAMKLVGYDYPAFSVLIAQQVNLIMDGQTVKMSKRLGQFSTMKELIDEIGTDVARFFFVMRSMESHLDFDLVLAKKESSENPVFYLQYAHARICSLFAKAAEIGYDPASCGNPALLFNNNDAVAVMKLCAKFPEEIEDAAQAMEPHRLTTFLMRLAQSFHKFYANQKIITDDPIESGAHLFLCASVRIVMKNGLQLLGVTAPEKM